MKASMKKFSSKHLILILYFSLYIVIALSLLCRQPFGNPPDEYNRFLIPSYIAKHGTLPNGYEEAIRIPGYGFSYAFQPILPYMLQGYAMRFISLFTQSEAALLYTARSVDFLFGLIMALFVYLLGREWFTDRRFSWLFSFLVTFLPQSIFIHTYVNTDSCCMMSIAIMLYGLTKGIRTCFSYGSCIFLSLGIILCALSYYNAYGYILSCILLFTAFFFSLKNHRPSLQWKPFLQKGMFISLLVLAGISWWFIRSFLLYDGDFLGLKTRNACALLYAIPECHPDTRITWQSQGYTLAEMLLQSDFINLSLLSFIGIYGPMTIVTGIWIYRFYKLLFAAGLLCCALPQRLFRKKQKKGGFSQASPDPVFPGCGRGFRIFFHMNMVFCMVMPCILSLYYSYTTDYQPQGRYLLPALLPLAYYCVRGVEKPAKGLLSKRFSTGLCMLFILCMVLSLVITVYGYAFPYYAANPIAP